MKHHQVYHVSEDVLNVLGRNLVLVAQGQRTEPGARFQINSMKYPASHLLNSATITPVEGGYKLNHKLWKRDYFITQGTASKWMMWEGMTPSQAVRFYMLSEGDPSIEICDWNTSVTTEYNPETRVATIINTSTINGIPAKESPFNAVRTSGAYIFGDSDELTGINFIGNIEDGNKTVDFNKGGCRLDFFKISNGHVDLPILEKDSPITEEGVDIVFVDTDINPETFYFQPYLGMKGISEYATMPTLGINLQSVFS